MPRKPLKEHSMLLYEAIMQLNDVDECFRFFQDVCSPAELYAMEQRFEVAKLLHEGQVYTDIMEQTKASSATISRVNRVLNYGEGGLNDLFERQQQGKKKDET
ncbi:MAG: YerC/YecD family TrpR-related protein [Butyricicoccaceae bacterium]